MLPAELMLDMLAVFRPSFEEERKRGREEAR
jgi:hypothetical protein